MIGVREGLRSAEPLGQACGPAHSRCASGEASRRVHGGVGGNHRHAGANRSWRTMRSKLVSVTIPGGEGCTRHHVRRAGWGEAPLATRPPALVKVSGYPPSGLLECGERRLNALALVFGDQARKHLPEVRVLGARVDVLPAVSLEESGFDRPARRPLGRTSPRSNLRRPWPELAGCRPPRRPAR